MKKVIAGLAVVVSFGTGLIFATQDQQDSGKKIQKETTPFMTRKLDNARDIVSGLATEDFKLISKSAQDLMLLSHEADWNVLTTPEYLNMSREFRASANRLRDSANDESVDGATLAYFEVTLNCVRCHKYIRNHNKK